MEIAQHIFVGAVDNINKFTWNSFTTLNWHIEHVQNYTIKDKSVKSVTKVLLIDVKDRVLLYQWTITVKMVNCRMCTKISTIFMVYFTCWPFKIFLVPSLLSDRTLRGYYVYFFNRRASSQAVGLEYRNTEKH